LDALALFYKGFALVTLFLVLWLTVESSFYASKFLPEDSGAELYCLPILICVGSMWMASARDLLTVFVSLELTAVAFYVMVAMARKSSFALEAGVKYLILGALSTGILVYGIAWIYGTTDSMSFDGIAEAVTVHEGSKTALLFAGRAGTSLTAEIGLMKAGEQISAMDLMAVDPTQRILAPRFAGGLVAMPILAILFSAVGIVGAYIVAVLLIGVDSGNFWSIMQSRVDVIRDIGNGVVKSFVFGLICTFVALYQGYESDATPEGVAYATTRTVVFSSLGILFMDFILTALMFTTE
jgi:hypothetical protein